MKISGMEAFDRKEIYSEMLRLLRKYGDTEKETLGQIFIRVASALERREK